MVALQRFGNPPLYVDDFVEIFLSIQEKLEVGKIISGVDTSYAILYIPNCIEASGQIFSDVEIPVVLFMENDDMKRVGYRDTHKNISNINLDYGAAVATIAVESVA
jgi:hypothetical protein